MGDPFILACEGLPPGARVVAFEGVEEISTTYRYEVDILVDPDADLSDAVGSAATLTIGGDASRSTVVHGVLGSASVVDNLDDLDLYRVVLVPRVRDLLGLDRHSRVFVGEPVPAILQTLLREAGLQHEDCEFRLTRTYEPVDFVCQYRESTLDFVMRWMERDGIYFYFAHDGARERLVILDDKGQHGQPRVRAPFVRALTGAGDDRLRRFRAERRAVPGRVHVDDYDYLRPALPVRGEASVHGGNGGELRIRGARVTTPKEANRIAKLRAEGLRARQTVFHGEGYLLGLHAGEIFQLNGHPRASLDGDYVATKLRIVGRYGGDLGPRVRETLGWQDEGDGAARVDLEAIWADVQFRPELRTQPPRVSSMESGVIEGDAESEYSQLDDHGRYLVKFRFDERDGRGSQASARIRMMQPHAGSPEGMHFPLRKGTEVLIAFVGGDPDRPVIAGAVPNALTPAVVRGDNATKNVVQTGGLNRITMEDAEGRQYIHIKTPHKNSYLHMGSTFNPQYNVVKNTDGTSLTYTTQLSTSYTGDDTETIVERARVTVIGRGMMNGTDATAANEVSSLLGPSFIQYLEEDIPTDLLVWINTNVAATAKDVGTANTSAGTAAKLKDWQKILVVLAGPPDAYVQTTCVQYDLGGNPSGATTPTTYPQPPNGLLDSLQQWLAQNASDPKALLVQTDANTVQTDLTNAIAAVQAIITAGVDPPAAALTGPAVTAIGKLKTDTTTLEGDANKMQQATTSAMPASPSPNIQPQYINILRGTGGADALPDPTLPMVTSSNDATALDVLDTNSYPSSGAIPTTPIVAVPYRSPTAPYPFAAGSDLKIVGGDNVTLAANDARSQTRGHAYGLVQGGQTSVVYSADRYQGGLNWQYGDASTRLAQNQADVATAQAALAEAHADQSALDDLGPVPSATQQDGRGNEDPSARLQAYLSALQQLVASVASHAHYPVNQTAAAQAQSGLMGLGPPPTPARYYSSEDGPTQYRLALQAYDGQARAVVKAAFDAAVTAAQGTLNSAQVTLEALLETLPIRPPGMLPASWVDHSIATTSVVYGNARSWLDGMSRTTVTHGVHSVVYSPANAPQATPSEPNTVIIPPGSSYVMFQRPSVDSTVIPTSNVAQASEIYGDQYSFLSGSQNAAITGNKTTIVAGHQSTTIQGGQDTTVHNHASTTIHGGRDTTIYDGQTTTIYGVRFGFDIGMYLAVDLLKIALTAANFSIYGMSTAHGVFTTTQTLFYLKNHGTDIETISGIKSSIVTLMMVL
jgi:type VI secretion system secreted protein VgrG